MAQNDFPSPRELGSVCRALIKTSERGIERQVTWFETMCNYIR